MASGRHWEQDKEATVYVGNLDERVTDHLVWELMLQAGRIVNVHLPKDRVSQIHQGYGFVEFISEEDADYAAKIMNQVRLYGKPIRVNKASADKQKSVEVGAELFVGNLDAMVDERTLYETFSRFGTLINPPKVARDDANLSKGYGFVSFADFDASDNAIANMHGQYLMNKEISVQYAYKKDGKGERHGDEAERMLAAQAQKNNVQITHQPLNPQLFQAQGPSGPPSMANGAPNAMPLGFGGGGGGPPQRQMQTTPLPPPPSSLPSRPPPSQAGYGGPAGGPPPGFPQQAPPQGFPGQMPPGYGGYPPQPPGFGAPPPGLHMQMGGPPGMPPPGYPQAYGR